MYNLALEFLAFINLFIINVWAYCRRDKRLFLTYWLGVFFALFWELHGTGFQWIYPGYNFYIFEKIPIALIFGWPWWITYIFVISERMRKTLRLNRWYHPPLMDWVIATIFGGILENTAVVFKWWVYTSPKEPLLPYISYTVWLGWGIPVVVVIHLARWIVENLER